MNETRCILATERMEHSYWQYSIREMVFKQSLFVHKRTERFPYVEWNQTPLVLPKPPVFGQIGYAPKLRAGGKLTDMGIVCRNMGMFGLKNILVQHQNGSNHRIWLSDFHAVDKATDPTERHHMEFAGYADRVSTAPQKRRPDTLSPLNMRHEDRYPDAKEWAIAYNNAREKLDREHVIEWRIKIPLGAKPLPSTVSFTYKWNQADESCKSRAP